MPSFLERGKEREEARDTCRGKRGSESERDEKQGKGKKI